MEQNFPMSMRQKALTEMLMLKTNLIMLHLWRKIAQGRAYPRLLCLPQPTLTSSISRRQHSSSEHLERRSTAQNGRLLFLQGWDSVPEKPFAPSLYFPTSILLALGCTNSLDPSACEELECSSPQGIPPQLQC